MIRFEVAVRTSAIHLFIYSLGTMENAMPLTSLHHMLAASAATILLHTCPAERLTLMLHDTAFILNDHKHKTRQ